MDRGLADFERLLDERLIPDFCADGKRGLALSSFKRSSLRVSELDAQDFMRAWRGELIRPCGCGLYRAANSSSSEQFFWEGRKDLDPRPFGLWLEPVITVAALARLHFDFGWPKELIGSHSDDHAFGIVTHLPEHKDEFVAGEVKKSVGELERLIDHMTRFGWDTSISEPSKVWMGRNAFRKVAALRSRKAPVFWAVGPGGHSTAFSVAYGSDGIVDFTRGVEAALLRYPGRGLSQSRRRE